MEKIKRVIQKNKAAAIVGLIVVLLIGSYFLKKQFKKSAPKAKTQQVKTNADGTLKTNKKSKKDAASTQTTTAPQQTATTSTDTSSVE